jgi:hypothetical protein
VENPCDVFGVPPPPPNIGKKCLEAPKGYEPEESALPEDCRGQYFTDHDTIEAGQVLGFVGKTGSAFGTGDHVHYTVFRPEAEGRDDVTFPSCNGPQDALFDWARDKKWINIYPFLLRREVDSCEAPEAQAGVDLVIAIDTTQSMALILAAIQAAADPLLQYMESRLGPGLRVSIVDYRDEPVAPWGGAQDYRLEVQNGLSSDHAATLAAIRGLDIGWGGDWPESVFSALIGVLEGQGGAIDWRPGAAKFIVLIGDAPPHLPAEPYAPGYSFADVIAAMWALAGQAAARLAPGLDAGDAPAPPLAIHSVVVGDSPDTLSAFAHLASETGGGLLLAADESAIVDTLLQAVDDMAAAAHPDENNQPPDTQLARPGVDRLWPPGHDWHEVAIAGVVDPDGDPVRLTITGITQDEPVSGPGAGPTGPDASGIGQDRARLRAERDGGGDGRMYEITFLATDGRGGRSTGRVRVCVPRDQKPGSACGDDGQAHDATLP